MTRTRLKPLMLFLAASFLALPSHAAPVTGQQIVDTAISETTGNRGHYRMVYGGCTTCSPPKPAEYVTHLQRLKDLATTPWSGSCFSLPDEYDLPDNHNIGCTTGYWDTCCTNHRHYDCVGFIYYCFKENNALDLIGGEYYGPEKLTDLYSDRLIPYRTWYTGPASGRCVGDLIIYLRCNGGTMGHLALYAGVIGGQEKKVDCLPDQYGAAVRDLHPADVCINKGMPTWVLRPYETPCTGSLRICKYDDRNLNGQKDGGEELANWPFHVTGPNNYANDVSTGSDGCVTIENLDEGSYTVTESVPAPDANGRFTFNGKRWRTCSGTPDVDETKDVVCNQTTDFLFCNVCLGSVTVHKFNDLNMDRLSAGDPPIPNWPVTLKGTTKAEVPVSIAKTTDATGTCVFPDLDPGDYTVSEEGTGISWSRVPGSCGTSAYCDVRATTADGKRWLFTVAKEVGQNPPDVDLCTMSLPPSYGPMEVVCTDKVVEFGNVCLSNITACKFNDCNMSGAQDGTEAGIPGWPVRLTGTRANGQAVCQDALTGADGCFKFEYLAPGNYTISEEGNGIAWEKAQTTCGAVSYCDWRATWDNKRWQSTLPRPADDCGAAGPVPSIAVPNLQCSDRSVTFGNVELGEVTAFKYHDMNLDGTYDSVGETDAGGDGKWTPGEPFTDLNCDGVQNGDEYYNDLNGNDVWDAPEAFTDTDGDGNFDWPESPIHTWPFALTGLRADGRPISHTGTTASDGTVTFPDIPPSGGAGYRLAEDDAVLHWCGVSIPWPGGLDIYRCSHTVTGLDTGIGPCGTVDRWQNTTTILRDFVLPCGTDREEEFGNICLSTVTGIKQIYDDGMPGQADPVFRPWEISLGGKDHLNQDVRPSGMPCSLLPPASQPPIAIPCENPVWYSTWCDGTNGYFQFVDLLPGHYHLTEQPDADYRMLISRPMLCGFDVMCCPQTVEVQNIREGLAWKVYQAYPGDSNGLVQHQAGYGGSFGELITAVPGVLQIIPGDNWTNFKQGAQLCRETPPKNTKLTKEFKSFSQCADVFEGVYFQQHGTDDIRTWWPLMYEPPTTTWTLVLSYGTSTPVRFPGEAIAGYFHQDTWKWVVDTDIEHMKLFVDLLHETPHGLSEVPLISDERILPALHARLDQVQAAFDANNLTAAGGLLADFEMQVMDSCITSFPARPHPTGPGLGIANTKENPACCKLLVDAEYVGRSTDAFAPAK